MKNLIYKEIRLVIQPPVYIMALCGALVLVPAYPYFVGVSYSMLAILICFSVARANNDHVFTSMLPIHRKDIVGAKLFTVCFTELLTLLVAIPCAILSSCLINTTGNIVGMDANFAFFGLTLIAYSVFNIIFLPWYFKTGYKTGVPMAVAMIVYVLLVCLFELVINLVPFLKTNLDSLDPATFGYQLIVLAFGVVMFLVTAIITYKKSNKNFKKVSL